MNIEIRYSYDELQQAIDLLTYYKGEAYKREDINADMPQTGIDQSDVLKGFLHTACNEVASICVKRMLQVEYSVGEDTVEFCCISAGDGNASLVPLLKKALFDDLVNYVIYLWMITVREEWAQTYMRMIPVYRASVEKLLGMLYQHKVRRRSTDLAGI